VNVALGQIDQVADASVVRDRSATYRLTLVS
jgi:hypothetical protein